ncbi:ATP-dependent Clp protease adaptor ClpS [Herpetosiphon llansteffanensis]|uniref:ATP-dependent Clp protease adaptor ClpS n=1 Tax=Herpetosiphon llansteffanensis TaxID=2094568 RepID=UPI000D7BC708|nr:ATP-dependent Clp protease adaptor ClpS [Herpetosiphon llansteffanensis]
MNTPRDVATAEPQTTTDVELDFITLSDEELEKPYRVILQNDDITPMEVVVWVLEKIFEQSFEQASSIMLEAHLKGHALVTILPFKEANSRVYSAQSRARDLGFPLVLFLEPDF